MVVKDNVKIAEMLQRLFARNAYMKDIPTLPEEHAISVLNLTHYVSKKWLNRISLLTTHPADPGSWAAR
jgi:hypothetical protein